MVAVINRLRELGVNAGRDDLAGVGGEAELHRYAEQISTSDVMDVAAGVLVAAWDLVDRDAAARLLLSGVRGTPDPLAFTGTVDVIFEHPDVLTALTDEFNDALLTRAATRVDPRQAHIAVDAVEGALRLCLSGAVRPFRLLELLCSVTTAEQPRFAEAAARHLGVIYLHMPDTVLRREVCEALQTLTNHHNAGGDAMHELGAAWLVDALEAGSAPEVTSALRTARQYFSAAIEADHERLDARLYANALDGLLALVEARPAHEVQAAADEVHDLTLTRAAWHTPGRLGRWLGDRCAAEQEWWTLAAALAAAAHVIEDDVWMNAAVSLEAIARAHRATRIARVLPMPRPACERSLNHASVRPSPPITTASGC